MRIRNHRCDIRTPTYVIELQHSTISATEIQEREKFYGQMVWIFDLRKIASNLDVPKQTFGAFRWPRFRKSLAACQRPVFIHLRRGELLHLFDYGSPRYHCHFRRFTKDEFFASVGAASSAAPVSLENFTVHVSPRISATRQQWWREHDLRTQPWLQRDLGV